MTAPLQPTPVTHVDGALLLGDYALGARVDRRAAADVYEATHRPTGEPRLVYVLHATAARDNPLVHRVVCEIDAARWLRHPATAKVDGHGETPMGAPYVAVLRPAGRTLAQVLAAGELPGRRRFVRLANRLVEALDEAHAVGLFHGRLTPLSIVVGDERDEYGTPQLTITGFGVAALAHDGPIGPDERPYVAPELQAGGEPDERSDVFALASVLHHLLVGSAPGAPGPIAAGTSTPAHPSAVAVLAAARAAAPAHRSRSVKAFWEELVAALVDDAAAVDAAAVPAPVASQSAARTSGEVAVRTLLEQLEHERQHAPSRADAPKATLLSPMTAARPAAPVAPVPMAIEPVAPMPAPVPAPGPAGVAAATPGPVPAAPAAPAAPQPAAAVPPARAIPARPPKRSRHRPRPGFLLAVGIAAPLAFLAVFRWPGPIDAAPISHVEAAVALEERAATSDEVERPRPRRARPTRPQAPAPADSTDSLFVEPLPMTAPIVIPTVKGLEVPAVRAAGAVSVRADEFRRMRVGPDSLP